MTSHERTEWTLAHDHASDTDLDPSDADVDPVAVTAEQVAAWREGMAEAWERGWVAGWDDRRIERLEHTNPYCKEAS